MEGENNEPKLEETPKENESEGSTTEPKHEIASIMSTFKVSLDEAETVWEECGRCLIKVFRAYEDGLKQDEEERKRKEEEEAEEAREKERQRLEELRRCEEEERARVKEELRRREMEIKAEMEARKEEEIRKMAEEAARRAEEERRNAEEAVKKEEEMRIKEEVGSIYDFDDEPPPPSTPRRVARMSTTFVRRRRSVVPSPPRADDDGREDDIDEDVVDAPTTTTATLHIPALAPGVRFPAWARSAELRLQASSAVEATKIIHVFDALLLHSNILAKFTELKKTGKNALQIVQALKVDPELATYQKKVRRRPNWARFDPNKDTIRAHSIVLKNEAEDVDASDAELRSAFMSSISGRAQQLAVLKKESEPDISANDLMNHVIKRLEDKETSTDMARLYNLKPKENESANDYANRLIEETTRILFKRNYTAEQVDENARIVFINNIGGTIGERLQDACPETWEKAVEMARQVEARLKAEGNDGKLGAFRGRGGGKGGRGGRGGGQGGRNDGDRGNDDRGNRNNDNRNRGDGGGRSRRNKDDRSGTRKSKGAEWILDAECNHCHEIGHIKIGCPKLLAKMKKDRESKNSKRGAREDAQDESE